DAALRLFHLHAEGMGLVIIATTMTAATLAGSDGARRALIALLTVGGAGYPFGYLLSGALIPYVGIQTGKTNAECLVWISFGSLRACRLAWKRRRAPRSRQATGRRPSAVSWSSSPRSSGTSPSTPTVGSVTHGRPPRHGRRRDGSTSRRSGGTTTWLTLR